MRPNSRRHDEHAPHVRAPQPPQPAAQPSGRGTGTPPAQRRSRGRRKRAQATPPVERPAVMTDQPEVRSAVEAALAEDDSVAAADE